ncbi:glycosyltransferase family 2 protein [Roseicyclus sp.]|uniref:glycosyltransferase family 2 protein n=1 Tax=Roseicyclus sp. TaxID=1914329 RepID=UPI003FA117EE
MTPVSVIIPAYNADRWLDRTLNSVRAQTHADLEIIVVDDGSTDGTSLLVRRHAREDGRIRLVSQENAGVAAARNRGIELARGRWIAPLDADDLWHPRTVERFLAAAAAAPAPVAFVYTWSRRIDEEDRLLDDLGRPDHAGDVLAPLLVANFVRNASATLLDRAAVLAVGGYDAGFQRLGAHGAEDIDLYLRLAARGAVAVAPGHHVGYRQTRGAMSANAGRMRASADLALAKLRQAEPDLPERLFTAAAANYDLYAAGLSFLAGRWRDLGGYILAAMKRAPLTTPAYLATVGTYALLGRLRGASPLRFADLDPDRRYTLPIADLAMGVQYGPLKRTFRAVGARKAA